MHKQVSRCKSSAEVSAEPWFHSKSGHLKWGRRLGDEGLAHKMAGLNESL